MHNSSGGVNTAMCDGSVQFIVNSIGESAWFFLHRRRRTINRTLGPCGIDPCASGLPASWASKQHGLAFTGPICLCLAGCGPSTIVVNGKVLLNGQPFLVEKNERATVVFHAIRDDQKDVPFPAALNPDGTFTVGGYYRNGIPPGKYRVSFSFRSANPERPRPEDFKADGPDNSPWLVEVRGNMPELTLSLNSS